MKRRETLLARAAERAAGHAPYLGSVLARYVESEALDRERVAAMLGTAESLDGLALCLRPRPDHFAEDVRQIASRHGVDAAALGHIVRFVDALAAMTERDGRQPPQRGAIMAARARKRDQGEGDGRSH
jgi:hypothetical protein